MDRDVSNIRVIKYSLNSGEVEDAVRNYVNDHKTEDGIQGSTQDNALVEWETDVGCFVLVR